MGELRALFDALKLSVTYHHARKEADVEITLHEGLADTGSAQVWSVPPVGAGANLSRLVKLTTSLECNCSTSPCFTLP